MANGSDEILIRLSGTSDELVKAVEAARSSVKGLGVEVDTLSKQQPSEQLGKGFQEAAARAQQYEAELKTVGQAALDAAARETQLGLSLKESAQQFGVQEATLRRHIALRQESAAAEAQATREQARAQQEAADAAKKALQQQEATQRAMKAAAVGALAAIGAAATAAGVQYENATSIIVRATGATGEKLKELQADLKAVLREVPESASVVAAAIGDLNTRLGLTGPVLQAATKQMLAFARVNSVDVAESTRVVTQTMNDMEISADRLPEVLDKLTAAGQASGISVTRLAGLLGEADDVLAELGLGLDESIALFAQLEKAGAEPMEVIQGLSLAMKNMAKEGVTDAKQALGLLMDEIKTAPTLIAATDRAVEIFGRSGVKMAADIRSGKLALGEMLTVVQQAEGTLQRTADASETTADRLGKLKNQIGAVLEPAGSLVVGIGSLGLAAQGLVSLKSLGGMTPLLAKLAPGLVGASAAAGTAAGGVGLLSGATSLLSGTLAALTGPVGLTVLTIGALSVATYKLLTAESDLQKQLRENREGFVTQTGAIEDALRTYEELRRKQGLTKEETERLDAATRLLAEASGLSREAFDREAGSSDRLTGALAAQVRARKDLYDEAVGQARDAAHAVQGELQTAQAELQRVLEGTAVRYETAGPGGAAVARALSAEERVREINRLNAHIGELTGRAAEAKRALDAMTGRPSGDVHLPGPAPETGPATVQTAGDRAVAGMKKAAEEARAYQAALKEVGEAAFRAAAREKELGKSSKEAATQFGISEAHLERYIKLRQESASATKKAGEDLRKLAEDTADLDRKIAARSDLSMAALTQRFGKDAQKIIQETLDKGQSLDKVTDRIKALAEEQRKLDFKDLQKSFPKVLQGLDSIAGAVTKLGEGVRGAGDKHLAEMLDGQIEAQNRLTVETKRGLDRRLAEINLAHKKELDSFKGNRASMSAVERTAYDERVRLTDAFYQRQRDLATGAASTIEERMSAQGLHTQAVLDQMAADAMRDYEQMTAAVDAHTGEAIYNSAQIQAAWERMVAANIAATGQWSQSVHKWIGSIPGLLQQALTGGGGFGGFGKALASMIGADVGKSLFAPNGALGGVTKAVSGGAAKLFGNTFGQALGLAMPGIGAAIGALAGPMVEKLAGWLTKPAYKDIMRRVGESYGVEISEGLAREIEKQTKELFGGDRRAAELFNLDKIIQEGGGLNEKNIGKLTERLRDVFVAVQTGTMTAAQAAQVLDKNWATFAASATDSHGILTDSLREIVRLNGDLLTGSKAIADYVKTELTRGAQGLAGWAKAYTDATDQAVAARKELGEIEKKLAEDVSDEERAQLTRRGDQLRASLREREALVRSIGLDTSKALRAVRDAMSPDEIAALADGYREALQEGFTGTQDEFLRQQLEFYGTLEEGDARLKTWFSGATIEAFRGQDARLAAVKRAMSTEELAALASGYQEAIKEGFEGTQDEFLRQQLEFYQTLEEGDARLKTWFSGATMDAFARFRDARAELEADAEGIGAALWGTFQGLRDAGVPVTEALAQVRPAVEAFRTQLEQAGVSGGEAFDRLSSLASTAADEMVSAALPAAQGLVQGLVALHNTTGLTEKQFTSLTGRIGATFTALVDQGKDATSILALMQPELQTIWELQRKTGHAVDDTTASMLEQAEAAGIVGTQHVSAQDRMTAAAERTADALEFMAKKMGFVPAAADAMARGVEGAAGRMRSGLGGVEDAAGAVERKLAEAARKAGETFGGIADSARGAQDAVDGVSFGSSPGGIKEIPIQLAKAIDASREFASRFAAQMRTAKQAAESVEAPVAGLTEDLTEGPGGAAAVAPAGPVGGAVLGTGAGKLAGGLLGGLTGLFGGRGGDDILSKITEQLQRPIPIDLGPVKQAPSEIDTRATAAMAAELEDLRAQAHQIEEALRSGAWKDWAGESDEALAAAHDRLKDVHTAIAIVEEAIRNDEGWRTLQRHAGAAAAGMEDRLRAPLTSVHRAVTDEEMWRLLEAHAARAADEAATSLDDHVSGSIRTISGKLRDIPWEAFVRDASSAAKRATDAIDAVSFGHSPGGIKEIPIQLAKAARAARDFEIETSTRFARLSKQIDQTTLSPKVHIPDIPRPKIPSSIRTAPDTTPTGAFADLADAVRYLESLQAAKGDRFRTFTTHTDGLEDLARIVSTSRKGEAPPPASTDGAKTVDALSAIRAQLEALGAEVKALAAQPTLIIEDGAFKTTVQAYTIADQVDFERGVARATMSQIAAGGPLFAQFEALSKKVPR